MSTRQHPSSDFSHDSGHGVSAANPACEVLNIVTVDGETLKLPDHQKSFGAKTVGQCADRKLSQQIGEGEDQGDKADAFKRSGHGINALRKQCDDHSDTKHQ